MRNFKSFLVIMTAALLAACGSNGGNEVTETSAASETMETTSEISETTSDTTTTTIVTTETTAETTAVTSETKADEKKTYTDKPEIIPSDEVYEMYPVSIIYPEEEKTDITMEKEYIDEDFYNKNGILYCAFEAEYPVFSGGDKTVMDKINSEIKAYIDSIADMERQTADKNNASGDDEVICDLINMYDALETYSVYFANEDVFFESFGSWNVCGNLLAVNFVEYVYGAGAAHGLEEPVSMLFNLRTGEKVNLNEHISDIKGFARRVELETEAYMYLHGVGRSRIYKDSEFDDSVNEDNIENSVEYICTSTESGEEYLSESRITVGRGCIGRYLAPYEDGCYADGIRLIEVPIDDILPYLDEEGRELFGGAASAKSEPADIIEYGGVRYVSTVSAIPEIYGPLTESDYVFMSLFPNISYIELTNCDNIDFEKIAAMENIKRLYLNDCEFDDISPLFGSNVDYISGNGYNIPQEQAEEFEARDGRYISYDLIKENNTEVNDE